MGKVLKAMLGKKRPKGSGLVKFCSQCFNESPDLQQCSHCFNATYCSQECQKLAWPNHKPFCVKIKPAEVVAKISSEAIAKAAAAEADLLKMLEDEENAQTDASKKKKKPAAKK